MQMFAIINIIIIKYSININTNVTVTLRARHVLIMDALKITLYTLRATYSK